VSYCCVISVKGFFFRVSVTIFSTHINTSSERNSLEMSSVENTINFLKNSLLNSLLLCNPGFFHHCHPALAVLKWFIILTPIYLRYMYIQAALELKIISHFVNFNSTGFLNLLSQTLVVALLVGHVFLGLLYFHFKWMSPVPYFIWLFCIQQS
jgi:hypothetical protein